MLKVGTILHGTYRIESYLASGGFGNTYLANNRSFDEYCAIKEFYVKGVCQRDANNTMISISNTENVENFRQLREKFKKEARRLHSLNNPHVIKVYDLFEENGTAYYVMDYVDGECLSSRLAQHGPLPESLVRNYLSQILDGLESVHDAGIWHLDIKPANIMVDNKSQVKLIDFGASKQQNSNGGATMSTGVSYTNGYAPGEQMAQSYEKFGPWTDFYALGATLFKLLTNQNPPSVTDLSEDESEDKHVALPMPKISLKTRNLIVWMMQVNRQKRPQNVKSILNYLNDSNKVDDQEETLYANVQTAEEPCQLMAYNTVNPFTFKGRIGRLHFFLCGLIASVALYIALFSFGLCLGMQGLDFETMGLCGKLLYLYILFLGYYVIFSQGARRCHDLGHSGFYQLIPLYGLWMLFEGGEHKDNSYGSCLRGVKTIEEKNLLRKRIISYSLLFVVFALFFLGGSHHNNGVIDDSYNEDEDTIYADSTEVVDSTEDATYDDYVVDSAVVDTDSFYY